MGAIPIRASTYMSVLNIMKEIAAVLGNDLVNEAVLSKGWHRDKDLPGIYKNVGDRKQYQIYMEFCIGDFCVGLYRRHIMNHPSLIGDKTPCNSVEEAFKRAEYLQLYAETFADVV